MFRLTSFVASLSALFLLAAGPLCADIASQPMHVQMEVTKKCVKILRKVKDKRSADAAAAKLGELLKPYDKAVTAMGEQGDTEPEPAKRERKVPKNVQDKQKLDLGYELKRIRENENCRSDKLDAVLGKLPPSTTPPDNNSNSSI